MTTFFRVVKDNPYDLLDSFAWDLVARAEFERLAMLDPHTLSDIERAHRFYYLIMAGWGGEFHYPRFQTSITDGGHGNRLIGGIKTLRARLEPVHARLRTVIIKCLDWQVCFDRYDRKGVVMYIDPPYPGNKMNYIHNMREWEIHHLLAEKLARSQCQWIVSSYDNQQVRELFAPYHIIPVQSSSGMKVKKDEPTRVINKEALITNCPMSSDYGTPTFANEQLHFLP